MHEGCVHIHIRDGKISNIFCHLPTHPKEGVLHLKVNQILSKEAFQRTHPQDREEIQAHTMGRIYDLGPECYSLEDDDDR